MATYGPNMFLYCLHEPCRINALYTFGITLLYTGTKYKKMVPVNTIEVNLFTYFSYMTNI